MIKGKAFNLKFVMNATFTPKLKIDRFYAP